MGLSIFFSFLFILEDNLLLWLINYTWQKSSYSKSYNYSDTIIFPTNTSYLKSSPWHDLRNISNKMKVFLQYSVHDNNRDNLFSPLIHVSSPLGRFQCVPNSPQNHKLRHTQTEITDTKIVDYNTQEGVFNTPSKILGKDILIFVFDIFTIWFETTLLIPKG